MKWVILAAVIFFSARAMAEYRTYVLNIVDQESGKERKVQSTLGPMQYATIYPVNANEVVEYEDSWMCWNNTANKPTCPKPE